MVSEGVYQPSLCYLIILQPGGLPLYAQSFGFEDDPSCQSFGGRLKLDGNNQMLFGSVFSALRDLASEAISDQLEVIDLKFETYHILSLYLNEILFIGIFENSDISITLLDNKAIIYSLLERVIQRFFGTYSKRQILENPVRSHNFANFTEELFKLGIPLSIDRCRNCLDKCADEDKGCFPHLLYFEKYEQNLTS